MTKVLRRLPAAFEPDPIPGAGRATGHASTEQAPMPKPLPTRRIAGALAVVAVIFLAAFVAGTIPRVATGHALAAIAAGDPVPTVRVTQIKRGDAAREFGFARHAGADRTKLRSMPERQAT